MRHRHPFILAAAWLSIAIVGAIGLPKAALAAQLTLQVAGNQHVLKKGDIQSAETVIHFSNFAVSVSLGPDATKLLCTLTTQNIGKKMKMLLDGQVVIDAAIRSAICGGKILITGAFSKKEADDIVKDLKAAP